MHIAVAIALFIFIGILIFCAGYALLCRLYRKSNTCHTFSQWLYYDTDWFDLLICISLFWVIAVPVLILVLALWGVIRIIKLLNGIE
jgi:hypothetical protein